MTFVQITDMHLLDGDRRLYGVLDTWARFDDVVRAVQRDEARLDALVLTGDNADAGGVEVYRRLRSRCDELGVPTIATVGNHDDRAQFRAGFLGEAPSDEPVDVSTTVDGVRVIALDTIVARSAVGELRDEQLDRLADWLREPAERATVLAFHHSPLVERQRFLNLMTLREPERLARVVRGSDVKLIVCGHMHHVLTGSLGGVPVWSAPATAYELDVGQPDYVLRALTSSAYTRIDVIGDAVTATAVAVQATREEAARRTIAPDDWRRLILGSRDDQ